MGIFCCDQIPPVSHLERSGIPMHGKADPAPRNPLNSQTVCKIRCKINGSSVMFRRLFFQTCPRIGKYIFDSSSHSTNVDLPVIRPVSWSWEQRSLHPASLSSVQILTDRMHQYLRWLSCFDNLCNWCRMHDSSSFSVSRRYFRQR